ncbi:MAG: LPXTG cell wall anchor domain-containing protein, partial [Pseudoflavonifractor sp.]|nr:LPXTG cell wall anchor domain-containing protein [Pseudoflavonifractor sp.]
DLFDNFKNVMPGDHLTQTIRVQAAAGNDSSYKIYLYARVCGDNTDANKAFLNAMALTVSQGANKLDVLNAGEDAQGIYLGTFAQGTGEDLTVDLQVPIEMGNEFQNAVCYVDWYFYAEQVTGGGNGGGDDEPSQTPTTSEPGTTPTATPSEPVSTAVPSPAPSEDIGEGDVVIDEGDVPAGELPDIEINEEGVPMGDMPQTGDETNLPLLITAMVASGSAFGGILIFGRKRESDESK